MAHPVIHSISLFSGVGMLDTGVDAGLGYLGRDVRPLAYVEREAFACSQLVALMEAGCLVPAPVWTDVTTFPARQFRGLVGLIVAGFPCQDISIAGKRAGLDGKRSGLFFTILDIADDCDASSLFLENVSAIATANASVVDEAEGELTERAASRILGELADRGWDAEWIHVSASDVGASHQRERWFCLAVRAGRGFGELRESSGSDGFADGGINQVDDTLRGRHGHTDEEIRAGRHGAVDAGIGELAYPARHEWNRPHREDRRGRGVCETGGALEYATSTRPERRQDTGADSGDAGTDRCGSQELGGGRIDMGESDDIRSERGGNSWGWRSGLADASPLMADPSRTGSQGRELGITRISHGGGQEAYGPTEQLCGLFAPGPSDPSWAGIIRDFSWLAPATQPGVCGMVDGTPVVVDESRRHQLRAIGNGCVPLQAAYALVQLMRRLG